MTAEAPKKQYKSYLAILVFIWLVGAVLQYVLCCPGEQTTDSVPQTAVVTEQQNTPQHTEKSTQAINAAPLQPSTQSMQLTLLDSKGLPIIQSVPAITFPKGQAVANPISGETQQAFSGKLSQYFQQNPDKALMISGYYTADEATTDGQENMGLARAQALKAWLKEQGFPAKITAVAQQQSQLTGTDAQHLMAADFDIITLPPSSSTANVIRYLPFYLETGSSKLSGKDNFVFASNDFIAQQPLAAALEKNLQQTAAYLNDNPFHQLTITGRYHPSETNRSIFPDLGVARANHIKDYLMFLGVNGQQIQVAGQAYPEAVSDAQHHYLGMANFAISRLNQNALQTNSLIVQQLSDDIRANPLVLYFKTGTSDIQLSNQQRNRLLTISQYLSFSSEAKVIITGHTDSTGNREKNIQLGLQRAEFAAKYLEKSGLQYKQMIINSKGPDKPIADNNTAEGRSKNRRVVITVNDLN